MARINNIKPFKNLGIGDHIKEQLEIRNWDKHHIAVLLGLTEIEIAMLLNNDLKLSNGLSQKLSDLFGPSPEYWINIESNYQTRKVIENNSSVYSITAY